jgi:hypothetical protein
MEDNKSYLKGITMKQSILFTITFFFTITCVFSQPKDISKTKSKEAFKNQDTKKEYVYYDGSSKVTIYLEPNLLAEFGNTDTGKAHSRNLQPVKKMGMVKIWNIDGSSLSRNLAEGKTANLTRSTSPVFSEGGRLTALPGGIVVKLKKDTNANSWAKSKGINVEPLGIPNYYKIPTEPGLASLEWANSLKEDADVESATPNWWKEVSKR